jgi:hypothetical protein
VVTIQITDHFVHVLLCGALFAWRTYFDDRDPCSFAEQRESVAYGATRFARILSADYDVVCSQHAHPFGHDEDRATCLQNQSAGIERAIHISRRRLLPDDNEIRDPCLPRQRDGGKVQRGSPLHVSMNLPGSVAKPVSLVSELGPYLFDFGCGRFRDDQPSAATGGLIAIADNPMSAALNWLAKRAARRTRSSGI